MRPKLCRYFDWMDSWVNKASKYFEFYFQHIWFVLTTYQNVWLILSSISYCYCFEISTSISLISKHQCIANQRKIFQFFKNIEKQFAYHWTIVSAECLVPIFYFLFFFYARNMLQHKTANIFNHHITIFAFSH